jgi:long-chain fatty acid transport protein
MKCKFQLIIGCAGIAALCIVSAGSAAAAGFALIEQSASGIGNAFAGSAASAEDASTIFFNPAGMTYLPGKQILVGAAAVKPSINFNNNGSTTLNGAQALTGGNGGDAGTVGYVPNLYASLELSPTMWLGLGINAPFGVKTDYEAGWVGRYQALESDLKAININASMAFKVNDKISLGVGLSAQRAEATLSQAVDFGTICFGQFGPAACSGIGLTPQNNDGSQELTASDWGYGYNLGAIFQISPDMRIGVNYRSRIDYTLSGTSTFSGVPAAFGTIAQFQNTNATADLTMPDTASLSVFQTFDDKWDIMGDITWTHWSVFKTLTVNFANGAPAFVTPENWRDTWRLSLGTSYKLSQSWKLRSGVAWDQTPVPDQTSRTARIPDNSRTWISIGASWYFDKGASLDFGYAHLFLPTTPIDHTQQAAGTLVGNYNGNINILSVQAVWTF